MAYRWLLALFLAAAAAFLLLRDAGGRGGREARPHLEAEAPGNPVAAPEPEITPPAVRPGRCLVRCDGEPLEGARLRLFGPRKSVRNYAVEPPIAEGRTDARGSWEFEMRGEGVHRLFAEKEGFTSSCRECDEVTEIDLSRSNPGGILAVDPTGRPLPGAEAIVVEGGVAILRLPADASGRITPPSGVRLIVRAPGFQANALYEDERPATIVLEPGLPIAGRVVDETERPILGAGIFLTEEGIVEESDAEGRFRIDALAGRRFALDVHAEGFAGHRILATGGEDDLRIVLSRFARVEGRVVFPDGKPAPDARVVASVLESVDVQVGDALTDGVGRFLLEGMEPGGLDLQVSCEAGGRRFRASSRVVLASGESREGALFVLEPAESKVLVRVEDATGEFEIRAHAASGRFPWKEWIPSTRASESVLRVDAPPGTTVRVTVADDSTEIEREIASAESAEEARLTFRLSWRRKVRVRLLDAKGNAIPESARPRVAVTDQKGVRVEGRSPDFEVLLPEPGPNEHSLLGSADGYMSEWVQPWRPDDATPTVLRLELAGAVKGRILPPQGWDADAFRFHPRGGMRMGPGADSTGFFEEGFLLGQLELCCDAEGYLPVFVGSARIGPGEVVDLGEIRLPPLIDYSSVVVDSAGRPLGGARILAFLRFERRLDDSDLAISDAGGRFQVRIPLGCDCALLAVRRGHGAAVVRPEDLGRPVVLEPEGRLRVRGSRRDFRGPLWLRLEGQPFPWDESSEEPSEDPDERIHLFENLPPGRHTIVWWEAGAERTRPAEVRAGETTEVDLR